MDLAKIYIDLATALNRHSDVMEKFIAAGVAVGSAESDAKKDTKATTNKQETATADPIWYHEPRSSSVFGVVETEAEFKKLKKENSKLMKIPQNKYDALVAAAEAAEADSEENSDDEVDISHLPEYAQDYINALDENPDSQVVVDLFGIYAPPDLAKGAERTARLAAVKAVLAAYDVVRAGLVPEEKRKKFLTDVVIAMEAYFDKANMESPLGDDDGVAV